MGDMAGYELESIADMEGLRDEYALGTMSNEDAYDHGFINELGTSIGMDDAIDRMEIGVLDSLNSALEKTELQLTVAGIAKERNLNPKAIANLLKSKPTCNICESSMIERIGKYGVFYFCKCKDQKTVSKKYWNLVKIHT